MFGCNGCVRLAASVVAMLVAAPGPSWALSLAGKINRAITAPVFVPLDGQLLPFQQVDFLSPVLERLAARGADFPATSTTPGATFQYNPKLGIFEQSSSLGPVFAERADTIGAGRFEIGMSFLFGDLDEFDGGDFKETSAPQGVFDDAGNLVVATLPSLVIKDFSLEQSIFNFSATFGISDRWDVNLLMPIVYSTLSLRGDINLPLFAPDTGERLGAATGSLGVRGTAFGPGDLQLRTKYRLVDDYPVQIAGALALRFPTGREDDFQGLGDFTVTPLAVLSRNFGPHNVHANVGMEINADDLERTRVRYAMGGAIQIIDNLAFLVDILGSSSLAEDEFFVPGVQGTSIEGGAELESISVAPQGSTVGIDKTDLVDLATGFKFSVAGRVIAYLGAIVPLTDDGLRAPVLPTVSVEVPF